MNLYAKITMLDYNGKSFVWSSINYLSMFIILKTYYFQSYSFSTKVICAFLLQENIWNLSEWTLINLEKQHSLPHYWLEKGVKGTVETRVLPSSHRGSLEIMLTVPFINIYKFNPQQSCFFSDLWESRRIWKKSWEFNSTFRLSIVYCIFTEEEIMQYIYLWLV